MAEFIKNIPKDCVLVGVDNLPKARMLNGYCHPERAVYLLGSEDKGLSVEALNQCHSLICFESKNCLNVSVAGSIIMYDRCAKQLNNIK